VLVSVCVCVCVCVALCQMNADCVNDGDDDNKVDFSILQQFFVTLIV